MIYFLKNIETKDEVSIVFMKAFTWIVKELKSMKKATQFLVAIYQPISKILEVKQEELMNKLMNDGETDDDIDEEFDLTDTNITKDMIIATMKDLFESFDPKIIEGNGYDTELESYLKLTSGFLNYKGLTQFMENGIGGVILSINGRIFPNLNENINGYQLMSILMEEQRTYMMNAFQNKIKMKTNYDDWIYQQSNVLDRFSPFLSWLANANTKSKLKVLSDDVRITNGSDSVFVLNPTQMNALKDINGDWTVITHDKIEDKSKYYYINMYVIARKNSKYYDNIIDCLGSIKSLFKVEEQLEQEPKMPGMPPKQETKDKIFGLKYTILNDIDGLDLDKNENYIILNGEVIPLDHIYIKNDDVNSLTKHDLYSMLTKHFDEVNTIYDAIFNAEYGYNVNNMNKNDFNYVISNIINILYNRQLISGFNIGSNLNDFAIKNNNEELRAALDSLTISVKNKDDTKYSFYVNAILDPLSPTTQKIISFLYELYNYNNIGLFDIDIVLNPIINMKDDINKYGLPKKLNRYYKFVFNPSFIPNNNHNNKGIFLNMPQEQVLTMGIIDTPGTWSFESIDGKGYDLDNILLKNVNLNTLTVQYSLQNLLIQGQCFDENGEPIAGLQLLLNDKIDTNKVMDGTIVMQNLGYFQLKSHAGLYRLNIRDGRSSDIYQFDIQNTTKSPFNSDTLFAFNQNSVKFIIYYDILSE